MLQLRFTNASKPPMWLVAPKYTFGTNHDCDCILTHAGVEPVHAQIVVVGEAVSLVRKCESGVISVNGADITQEKLLSIGDKIALGEATFTVIDLKKESAQAKAQTAENTALRPAINPQDAKGIASWNLRPLNTTLTSVSFYSLQGTMLLGRSKECDISIPATHLSRKHAKFSVLAGNLTVEDLGSSNGTFVNGARVERVKLTHGDEVSFDTLRFRVESTREADDVTTLRPALDETQIRQAVTPEQLSGKAGAAGRKPLPVRPNAGHKSLGQTKDKGSRGDSLVFVLGAGLVVAVVVFLAWFLLV